MSIVDGPPTRDEAWFWIFLFGILPHCFAVKAVAVKAVAIKAALPVRLWLLLYCLLSVGPTYLCSVSIVATVVNSCLLIAACARLTNTTRLLCRADVGY